MELLGLVMHSHHEDELQVASRTLAEVVTIFVFLVVGAALPFGTLADHWAPSLAVVAMLLVVARPVAVLACTLPDRRARWTRAASSRSCAGRARRASCRRRSSASSPASASRTSTCSPGVVALAIVATLLLQATPAPWLARRLGLLEPAPTAPG